MPKRQRLLHRPRVAAALGHGIAGVVRLLQATGRWEVDAHPETLAILRRGAPAIGAFWHARLLLVPRLWHHLQEMTGGKGRVYAMVSAHGDGELIATALAQLGIAPVRGSTGRTGAKALLAARTKIDEGACIAIAADGPRGPAGHFQPGALVLARRTGLPVIPLTGAIRPHWRANSWDRLMVPLPFSRGVLLAGAPITVPPKTDNAGLEAYRLELTRILDALTAQADARVRDGS